VKHESLPANWRMGKIGDLLKIRNGYAFKSSEYQDEGALLIRQSNLGGKKVSLAKAKYLPKEYLDKYSNFLVTKGDILIGMSGSVGKLCSYERDEPALQNQRTGLLEFKDERQRRWIWNYLPLLEVELLKVAKGVAVQNISATQIENFPAPIAPPEQQKKIVEEVEKQLSRLDEAVANLKRVKANLKRYKASVLQAAVTGKLTEDWRKQNLPAPVTEPSKFYTYAILCEDNSIYIGHTNDIERRWREHREGQGAEWTKDVKIAHYEAFDSREEAAEREKWFKTGFGRKWVKRELAAGRTRQAGTVEPASKLLERILTERRQKWEEAEFARLRERYARGQAKIDGNWQPKNDKWKEKYKEPVAPDVSGLPDLPDGWAWAEFDQLISILRNGISQKPTESTGLGILRI